MRKKGKKISVCVLTYNHSNLIASTLQSLQDQTLSGFELIISDDCSTDGTWEIVQEYADQFEHAKAIQTPENLRMPGNANFAVAHSTRPYIALLHHDDVYKERLLEAWLETIGLDSDIGFVFNDYETSQSHQSLGLNFSRVMDGEGFLEDVLFTHWFSSWGCPVRGTAMIRRSCWDKVGGMREKFDFLADIDLWMRLAAQYKVGYVRDQLIEVRQERPEYYPDKYEGFSWERKMNLYDIHAENLQDFYECTGFKEGFVWFWFRMRVSFDNLRWTLYCVVRDKHDKLKVLENIECPYDFGPFRWLRRSLLWFHSLALSGN